MMSATGVPQKKILLIFNSVKLSIETFSSSTARVKLLQVAYYDFCIINHFRHD